MGSTPTSPDSSARSSRSDAGLGERMGECSWCLLRTSHRHHRYALTRSDLRSLCHAAGPFPTGSDFPPLHLCTLCMHGRCLRVCERSRLLSSLFARVLVLDRSSRLQVKPLKRVAHRMRRRMVKRGFPFGRDVFECTNCMGQTGRCMCAPCRRNVPSPRLHAPRSTCCILLRHSRGAGARRRDARCPIHAARCTLVNVACL